MADVEGEREVFDVKCITSWVGRAEHEFEPSDHPFIVEIGWDWGIKIVKINPSIKFVIEDSYSWRGN